MSGFLSIFTGWLEMQAGAALDVFAGGAGGVGNMLIAAGAGQVIGGIGQELSGNPVQGFATTVRNPIFPWQFCYGETRPKAALLYAHMWGDNNQVLDLVMAAAAHGCESFDELLFDQQRVQIDTTAIPTSAKAGYTLPWAPAAGSGTSFTPAQQVVSMTSIARANDVVTIVLPNDIPYLQAGDQIKVQQVTTDVTLNGTFQVAEIISRVPSGLTFTVLNGGSAVSITSQGQAVTLWADYGRNVYVEPMLGNQTIGTSFAGMTAGTPWMGTGNLFTPASPGNAGGTAGPNPWTNYCSCVGKTVFHIRLIYDPKYFAAGLPQISFHMHGKSDILDTRTSVTGYTNNAALCIADFLSNKAAGFGFAYTSDIPTAELNAAANLCDTATTLASGGTEPMYTCNGTFDLTQLPGETLDDMLTSCAGHRVELAGQQYIVPGSWTGPGSAVDLMAIASGPVSWSPVSTIRDRYNGCKGTYISPAAKWQATDFPYYAQDSMHGYSGPGMYAGDINLASDNGERRWLELHLKFTTSASMAQRIAKIYLLRSRFSGSGTFPLNLAGYQFAPMDVFQGTHAALSWSGKFLEVQKCRLNLNTSGKAPVASTEIDVQETDSSVYAWSTSEELTPQGYIQSQWPAAQVTETQARPWSPGYVAPLAGDAIGGPASFGVQPVYGVDTQGNATVTLQIKGTAPINVLDASIAKPQIFCTPATTGGTIPAGEYVVGLSAYDSGASNHGSTDYLMLAHVVTTGATSSIGVAVTWGSGDDGGDLYIGEWTPDGYVFHFSQTLSPGATSATITAFDQTTHGGPDFLFDHFAVSWMQEIHAGAWANQIAAVTATTITIGGNGMTTDLWAGYTLSLLAKYDPTVEIPILNIPILHSSASSGGTFTLTIGPGADGNTLPNLTTLLAPLDLVVMRGKYTFTARSFTDPNVANPYYPTGATGVEAGHVAVVMTGADAGDVQTIDSVQADGFGNDTIFNIAGEWEVTPATGDLVVICSPSESPEVRSAAMAVTNDSVSGVMIQPSVANLVLQTWLFRVRTEQADNTDGPDSLAPMREVYLFGGAGTLSLVMFSVDGTLAVQSDACPAVYLPAARTPSGAALYAKSGPVGADLKVSLYYGSTLWMQMTIPNGSSSVVVTPAQCQAAGALPAGVQLRVSVDQVGTTSPGSDLSLFLYR